MKELRFERFDWDPGNSTKSQNKHRIGTDAIEAFFANDPSFFEDFKHSQIEPRYTAIGRNAQGRWMLVSFTIRSKAGMRYLRPSSARYMHAKEVKRYENRD